MIELTYSRAADVDDAVRRAADGHGRYLGGGTNLVDLMRETVEAPSALVDVTGLSREIAPTAGRRTADRRGGAQHRGGRARGGPIRLSDARSRDRGGRLGADPQHGDGRRQPAAAHPLHVLLRHRRLALQQARPGRGMRRDRGLQPHARDPGRVARVRGHPPVGHVRRACGAGRRRPPSQRVGRAHGRRFATCTGCPRIAPISRRCSSPAS